MVRLPFASEMLVRFGHRSFVSGLFVGTRAVALMEIRTRQWSHFRRDPFRDQKGHQTCDAVICPCRSSILSREFLSV